MRQSMRSQRVRHDLATEWRQEQHAGSSHFGEHVLPWGHSAGKHYCGALPLAQWREGFICPPAKWHQFWEQQGSTANHMGTQPHPPAGSVQFSSVQSLSCAWLFVTSQTIPNYWRGNNVSEFILRGQHHSHTKTRQRYHTQKQKRERERERELLTNITDEVVKNLLAIQETANAGDAGSTPRSKRSPREGNGKPLLWECILAYIILLYSCLGNPTDKGAWQTTVHGVTEESDMT